MIYYTLPKAAYAEVLSKYTKSNHKDFTDHYLYIINVVTYGTMMDKRYTKESFYPVKHERLTHVISKTNTKKILTDLVKWDILEYDNHYIAGVKCIGYRINPIFNDKMFQYTVKDKLINKKVQAHRDTLYSLNMLEKGDLWISLNDLRIDAPRAMKFIRNKYTLNSNEYQQRKYSIDKIVAKEFFMTTDKSGRIHTNLTSLASELRKFLYLETGETLGEADITNSQPLFLYCALTKADTVDRKELKEYGDLVISGEFYETLNTAGVDRNVFKKQVLVFLFDKNRSASKVGMAFKAKFPNIYKYIWDQKVKNFKVLALILQREEANFIVGMCVPAFLKANGYGFVNTIHDSLMVVCDDLDLAQAIIENQFRDIYGINVKIKIKCN